MGMTGISMIGQCIQSVAVGGGSLSTALPSGHGEHGTEEGTLAPMEEDSPKNNYLFMGGLRPHQTPL